MNCYHLTSLIEHLAETNQAVLAVLADPEMGGMTPGEFMETTEEIDGQIQEIIDENFSIETFIKNLKDENKWRVFAKVYDQPEMQESLKKGEEYFYNLVRVVFANYPIVYKAYEDVENLYDCLNSNLNIKPEFFELIEKHFLSKFPEEERVKQGERILEALRSACINRIIERVDLDIQNGFNDRSDYLAAGLKEGRKVHVKYAGNCLGYYLNGGMITFEHARNSIGMGMEKGIISGEHGGEMSGMLMRGGRMYFRTAGEKCGWCSSSGTIFVNEYANMDLGNGSIDTNFIVGHMEHLPWNKKAGVIIAREASLMPVGKITYTALVSRFFVGTDAQRQALIKNFEGNVYGYNESAKEYFEHLHNAEVAKPRTDSELDTWKEQRGGLCVIDDLSGFQKPLTEGVKDGIMVIRTVDLPENIGAGMKGGVIVFDHPDLTPEKVKERVNYDPTGAPVMLVRVPDEENESRFNNEPVTKLVEVR